MRTGRYWSPYAAGALLGLTLLASFVVAGRGLGASGAVSLATGTLVRAVAPGFAGQLSYFFRYFQSAAPLLDWNVFLLLGVLAGALAGALRSGAFRWTFERPPSMSVAVRFASALAGGVLIGFAGRLARGCTSGVALTGGAQLVVAGWVFVIAMFASGFLFAALFRRFWS